MRVKRPASYMVFAVFNFILGGIGLLCSPFGLVENDIEFNGQNRTREYYDYLNREVPAFKAYTYGSAIGGMLIGVGLIASGVGLVMAANWGRMLAIFSCLLAFLHQVFAIFYTLAFVGPAVTKFFERYGPVRGMAIDPSSFIRTILYSTVIVAGVFAIFYLLEVILLAMAGTPKPVREEDADDQDYADDRPRRRYDDDDRPRRRDAYDDDRPRRRDEYDDDRPRRRDED